MKRRCYQAIEWRNLDLGDEAHAGLEIARRRVRTLPHDASHLTVLDWLVAAYLQGVIDGAQVEQRRQELEYPVTGGLA